MHPFYLKQQPTNSKSNLNDNGDPNKILTELRKNNFGFYQQFQVQIKSLNPKKATVENDMPNMMLIVTSEISSTYLKYTTILKLISDFLIP